MAVQHLSPALRAPASPRAHPAARPGYGKRSAPDQRPPSTDDFAMLPARERQIAGFLDRLPDGAAIDIKSLAKHLPLYGQMAVGSALRALGVAGHLRYVRCRAGSNGSQERWVTYTFWSRTARDNEWWDAFLTAQAVAVAGAESADAVPVPVPMKAAVVVVVPQQRATQPQPEREAEPVTTPGPAADPTPPEAPAAPAEPSPAYLALARLGGTEPRLVLSHDDCNALEELAADWLARGVDAAYLTHALTAGIPLVVDSPCGFVRQRLLKKLPPRLPSAPASAAAAAAPDAPGERRLMVECTECRSPGPTEALVDGLCRPCRTTAPGSAPADPPPLTRDIQAHVKHLRELLKAP
ncbi:MarR family transcriptional regulator [Streptomyces sp. NPDC050529]|uniref:MarR family transcriptional regulator n=1 Tax=Streptomyces sp. NPDC050529 TaxID=3365624 RepID=UPI003797F8F8